MKKWLCFFIGCMAWPSAYAMTLEEQYSGLKNCRFDDIFYDQKTKQFGPGATFFKENKDKLEICWQSDNTTSFCINEILTFYGLNVKELTLPSKGGYSFGVIFFNDEETVRRVLSKRFTLDISDNLNSLPSVDILPEDGYARVYCNLYNIIEGE
ncbi:hypothetical protein [Aeromonas cavernicola]|uniref:Uncharacterized protein n=1 Tax=Aeromonas cavernicola TaxID=1006623 RepID=A0A2H9U7U9_9GAMM|nr:hypothetical protein [Aeromonas cavernicola]PJG60081.1 hypothetical protein CUC53_03860 [Aeromonas cavernicola]